MLLRFASYFALVFLFLVLGPKTDALAANDECNLSRQPFLAGACPAGAVGAASPNPSWHGARLEPHSEGRSAIDAFGFCRFAGNNGDIPQFIPFGFDDEWRAYLTNHALPVYLVQCSRGGNIVMPPNFGSDLASNQCAKPSAPQSFMAPYKQANVPGDFTTPPVTYDCLAADGTKFTEEAIATLASHDSGYGPSDDIGWKITKVLYKYNAICGPAKGMATKTAPVTGLCSVGTPGSVIGVGPYTWICASGTGGGKNITCSSAQPCEPVPDEVQSCRCEEGRCYRPVIHSDNCGHSTLDKSQPCDAPEPRFAPLPPTDYDNDHLSNHGL
jgi:hypothetical protein